RERGSAPSAVTTRNCVARCRSASRPSSTTYVKSTLRKASCEPARFMVVPRQQNTSCTRGKSLSCARRSKSIRRCVSFLCVSGTSRRASTVTRSYAGFSSSSRSTWLPTRPDAPTTRAVRATRSAPEREQHAHDHEVRELIAGVNHPGGDGLLRKHVGGESDRRREAEPAQESEPQALRQRRRVRVAGEQRDHVRRDHVAQRGHGVGAGHALLLHLQHFLGRVPLRL